MLCSTEFLYGPTMLELAVASLTEGLCSKVIALPKVPQFGIHTDYYYYALTELKFSKHHSYFKYLLILSGDINLHAGPVKYPCSVCAKPVRKRIISCEK